MWCNYGFGLSHFLIYFSLVSNVIYSKFYVSPYIFFLHLKWYTSLFARVSNLFPCLFNVSCRSCKTRRSCSDVCVHSVNYCFLLSIYVCVCDCHFILSFFFNIFFLFLIMLNTSYKIGYVKIFLFLLCFYLVELIYFK